MSEVINVEVPTVGESISEVQIGQWFKQEGEWIAEGEDLVEIETEKASVQIPAPASGIIQRDPQTDRRICDGRRRHRLDATIREASVRIASPPTLPVRLGPRVRHRLRAISPDAVPPKRLPRAPHRRALRRPPS